MTDLYSYVVFGVMSDDLFLFLFLLSPQVHASGGGVRFGADCDFCTCMVLFNWKYITVLLL